MLRNVAFVRKEIYLYGKKGIHNVLCVGIENDDGELYYKPLTYSKKGTDGNYYDTYVVKDKLKEVIVEEFVNIPVISND